MKKSKIHLDFKNFSDEKSIKNSIFDRFLQKAIKIIGQEKKIPADGVITLSIVDDETIRVINKKYRSLDKFTDVISLNWINDEFKNNEFKNVFGNNFNLIGEIFISIDTAKLQALENGIRLKDEVIFLFVHGVLHIFGYDHENEPDYEEMFSLQRGILS